MYNFPISADTPTLKDVSNLADGLKKLVDGDVLSKDWERSMYATDASPYEILPLCVVLPKTYEDVVRTVKYAYKNNIPIIARGGGSGVVGQAIGAGIIIDFSRYLNKILDFSPDENYVIVQPGIYKSVLDKHLSSKNKFIPPDPSSSDFCTMGGMVANNACGAHTVKYGSTIDYVESLVVVLSNGEIVRTQPIEMYSKEWDRISSDENLEGKVYREVADICLRNNKLIIERTPKVSKNSSGYRLERVLKDNILDLGQLFVSSEGTLGIILEIRMRVINLPERKNVAVLHFDSIENAGSAVMDVLKFNPSALELIDYQIVELVERNESEIIPSKLGNTKAVLLVEFDGLNDYEIGNKISELEKRVVIEKGVAQSINVANNEKEAKKIWDLRKRALLLLYKIRDGDKRPVSFIEDVVVRPEKLEEYLQKVYEIYDRYQLRTFVYGHAGDGHLHTRPLLDLKTVEDNEKMVKVAAEVFSLVIQLGGSITGEHGDGLSRTDYVKHVYGDDVYSLFLRIKKIFDMKGIMNPGKKVTLHEVPINQNLRMGLNYQRREINTALNWGIENNKLIKKITGHNKELNYFEEVELCHGCGGCRETSFQGRMCPVYKAFEGEVDSCRGRNNLLRWMNKKTGLNEDFEFKDEYGDAIYKHCIQCKMCHVDCSSNVNVGKLMAEVRARYATIKGLPKGYKYFMDIDQYAELGSKLAPISNWLFKFQPYRILLERFTGIDRHRNFPLFRRKTFIKRFEEYEEELSRKNFKKEVVFFYDTYLNFNNPDLGMKIIKIFERNGYRTIVPNQKSSGLPALVDGDPETGRKIANFNISNLLPYASNNVPIVCFSPSAGITLKMDYLNVIDTNESRLVAENTFDIHEFLYHIYKKGELDIDFNNLNRDVYLHLHCHNLVQKVEDDVINLLNLIPGLKVHILERGCCGVGGSFSFIKDNFSMSLEIGKDLFNSLKIIKEEVYSTGESCMLQMEFGSKRRIGLTMELLAEAYSIDHL